ncbi:hypothetical protein BS47DRAFT_526984 [Hydnum rufescens UP504]|uniref:Uncharacterized protein n=1 Tax=Hydnum rufescens UP504 TaxID=1448309 RepID=A0A9P6E032_9AGAM|nr:hypothetical protein BS47DRAFT_526984 [Hydnum rufescens UP504]
MPSTQKPHSCRFLSPLSLCLRAKALLFESPLARGVAGVCRPSILSTIPVVAQDSRVYPVQVTLLIASHFKRMGSEISNLMYFYFLLPKRLPQASFGFLMQAMLVVLLGTD